MTESQLPCPKCGNAMTAELYGQIEVDSCTCGQLWFDHTELSEYVEQWSGGRLATPEVVGGHLGACPRCGDSELLEYEVSGQRMLRCGRCRGVSLERHRLERLLAEPSRPADEDMAGALRALVFGQR